MGDKIVSRIVMDRLSDGTYNVLEVPADYDVSKGLPVAGKFYKTLQEAQAEVQRLVEAHDTPER